MDARTDHETLAMLERTLAKKPKRSFSRKQIILAALTAAAVIGGSAYGYRWWTVDRFLQTTDDAYLGGDTTPISPHMSGFIAQIAVTDNQEVKAGQLLVRLDDRDARAAADHAQAVLDQKNATLTGLRAKYTLQQTAIDQARADLDAKNAQADFAKADSERYRALAQANDGTLTIESADPGVRLTASLKFIANAPEPKCPS